MPFPPIDTQCSWRPILGAFVTRTFHGALSLSLSLSLSLLIDIFFLALLILPTFLFP